METVLINAGSYENLEQLIKAIKTSIVLTKFSHQCNKITGVLVLFFGKIEGITFSAEDIPSILGFGGIKDGSSTQIGYKMIDSFDKLARSDGEAKDFVANFPQDLLAGKQLIFVYSNIIEYQQIGDTKAPLICVFDSKQRLKTVEIKHTLRTLFSNLEYKKLLSNIFQCIEVQCRTETGKLVPFNGTEKKYSDFNL